MKIKIQQELEYPKIEKEEFIITQIDKYMDYMITKKDENTDIETYDICAVITFLMEKLKSLNHDGEMKIELKKYIYYEEKEVDANEYFKGLNSISY